MFRKSSGGASPASSANGHPGAGGGAGTSSTGRTSPATSDASSTGKRRPGSSSGRSSSPTTGNVAGTTSSTLRNAAHIGSVVDDWPMYSSQPEDYVIGDVIGIGASSVVYQAAFQPLGGRACAVKVVDLEAFGGDTEVLRRETQLMSLSKHPNVLRVRGCWVEGTKLNIATRLMSSGSMLDIMRFSHPEGFDEVVIATVLKQALQGLNYLHINGWLHRDLKAANMLVDDDGTVLLGDFGVGIFLNDSDHVDSARKGAAGGDAPYADGATKSFVGTPCWMAPEVVERKLYGHKADIWSFGITTLELSQGRAPLSRLAPVKVLMKTLQDEPPMLDRTGGAHKYSKVMEDFVRVCLQKDPAKRPSAEKLLGHAFFKQAKSKKYLVQAILTGLPPLSERQERQRRNMSIVSLRNQASWDFGTGTVNSPVDGLPLSPSSGGILDPFRGFTGSIAAPISPGGSMRSAKIVSIDGEHALVTPDRENFDMRLADRFQGSVRSIDSPRGSRFSTSAAARRRTQSQDSFAMRHRKSVSFDFDDSSPSPSPNTGTAEAGDSNGRVAGEGDSAAASAKGSLRIRGGAENAPILEAIGEGKSPAVLPADHASPSDDPSHKEKDGRDEVPALDLEAASSTAGESTAANSEETGTSGTSAASEAVANMNKLDLADDAEEPKALPSAATGNTGNLKKESRLSKLFKRKA